jgi:hypothetical protein
MGPPLADGAHLASSPADRLTAQRLTSQLLAGTPARTAAAVAERLLAVQAQDGRAARLAIRARSRAVAAADLDAALGRGELVVNWLNRGTLHLVRSEDHGWLHALTAPALFTGCSRRLAQLEVSPSVAERAVATIERALGEDGPLGRRALAARLTARDIPTAGQALVHLLLLASLRGIAVRGPMNGREQAYAHVRDWLGTPEPVDRERALAELARRYLRGHAPADERDLARWAGLPLRDARAGFGAIAGELHTRRDGLFELARHRLRRAELPAPRLLGGFEPVLLGWTSRAAILAEDADRIVSGGLFRPFAMVGGRAAAVWAIRGGEVAVEAFAGLRPEDARALDRDAGEVLRYLGDTWT